MNYKKSIVGSTIALIAGLSCCWLPALLIALGGGSTLLSFSDGVESLSGIFLTLGAGLLAYGLYQYRQRSTTTRVAILQSIITCPECGHEKHETMPTNACQYFYECENCAIVLKPRAQDCCVYCSYGTVACPPIQLDEGCC